MEEKIKKLELHIIRLEQCIRQLQKLKTMGLIDVNVDEKINEYLDGILDTRRRIEKLKKQQGDAD